MTAGKDIITVKAAPETLLAIGEAVGVRFPPQGLHVFDAQSGLRVGEGWP